MKRREFLKKLTGICTIPICFPSIACSSAVPTYSRIFFVKDAGIYSSKGSLSANRVSELLQRGLDLFFDGDYLDGLKSIIPTSSKIGIKINGLSKGRMTTHPILVHALIKELSKIGIKKTDILIWDRFDDDLKKSGFIINTRGNEIRVMGNDRIGYSRELLNYRSIGSLISRAVTDWSDVIINIPVLKDHGIVGTTSALKNFFGAIHNPNKYHLNNGDPYIADLYSHPLIKDKVILTICDTFECQYEGGPPYHPQWTWRPSGIMITNDPVSLDYFGWQMIEEKRFSDGLPTLKEAGRKPSYIHTAANLKLGTDNAELIRVIEK